MGDEPKTIPEPPPPPTATLQATAAGEEPYRGSTSSSGGNNTTAASTMMTTSTSYTSTLLPFLYVCPIVGKIMIDPVQSLLTGLNFEHAAIMAWVDIHGPVCPVTGGQLGEVVRNDPLGAQISRWKKLQVKKAQKAQRRQERRVSSFQTLARAKLRKIEKDIASSGAASSYIASQTPKKSGTNDRQSSITPELFDKVQGLVQAFASHEIEIDQKRTVKSKKRYHKKQRYCQQNSSIFRNGPMLNIPIVHRQQPQQHHQNHHQNQQHNGTTA